MSLFIDVLLLLLFSIFGKKESDCCDDNFIILDELDNPQVHPKSNDAFLNNESEGPDW